MDIQFHCDEQSNFKNGASVRGFAYENYAIEPHNHDFYEVNIVLSGNGVHCIEQGRFAVKRGDVFVIPPMVTHAYEHTKELTVYHILIKKEFLTANREESKEVKGFVQLTEIEPFLRSNASVPFFLRLNPAMLMELKNELEWIDDRGAYGGTAHLSMKYHTVWKILYWLAGLLESQNHANDLAGVSRYEGQILNALEYIHQHYHQKITVELLCNITYLSRSTFLRNFQTVCGKSPTAYLNDYRCEKAVGLLRTAAATKTEIAHVCGFYDLSHMERMLKKSRKWD